MNIPNVYRRFRFVRSHVRFLSLRAQLRIALAKQPVIEVAFSKDGAK